MHQVLIRKISVSESSGYQPISVSNDSLNSMFVVHRLSIPSLIYYFSLYVRTILGMDAIQYRLKDVEISLESRDCKLRAGIERAWRKNTTVTTRMRYSTKVQSFPLVLYIY